MASKWAVWSYHNSSIQNGSFIEASIGLAYNQLRSIAKSMSHNGEGQRYVVRKYVKRDTKDA